MEKKKRNRFIIIVSAILVILLVLIFLTNGGGDTEESIGLVMKDAVLHEEGKISLFGLIAVNPALISAFTVTGIIFVFSLIVLSPQTPAQQRKPVFFPVLIPGIIDP